MCPSRYWLCSLPALKREVLLCRVDIRLSQSVYLASAQTKVDSPDSSLAFPRMAASALSIALGLARGVASLVRQNYSTLSLVLQNNVRVWPVRISSLSLDLLRPSLLFLALLLLPFAELLWVAIILFDKTTPQVL